MFGIGLVEVGEGTECSAVLVDLAVLPFLERAAEHQSNYCSRQQLTAIDIIPFSEQNATAHHIPSIMAIYVVDVSEFCWLCGRWV